MEIKESRKLHHKVVHHVKQHKTKFLIGLFVVVAALLLVLLVATLSGKKAKDNDTVEVNYVGKLADGQVFDTSMEDIAKAANIYNPQRTYTTLKFKIGGGQLLPDFEKAVVGMAPGEKKVIIIKAENAYPVDNSLIATDLPRTSSIASSFLQKAQDLSIEVFEGLVGSKVEMGKVYVNDKLPWNVKVASINESAKTVSLLPVLNQGENIKMPFRNWTATITKIGDEKIELFENVKIGDMLVTPDGKVGRVTRANESTYDIDLNLPMAGKDLTFEITLVKLN